MHRSALLLSTLGLAATVSSQTHQWVSPSGNDANAGTQAAPFLTINHAATVAAAGDIIRLAPGVYGDEQGSVVLGTKNLSLVGAGAGASVVRSHSSLDLSLPAGALLTPTTEPHRNALTIQGTARLLVRDLTLDGNFSVPSSGRAHSLWIGGGADVLADRVEFTNARNNPLTGAQGPVGVYARGDGASDRCDVTLRNCSVREFGKGGVVANFDVHLVMEDCAVDGSGHVGVPLPAQNGIQVSRGATCSLHRCTVTDVWYEPASFVASGILIFEPGSPLLVEDCNLGNAEMAIVAFGPAATVSGIIRRNRVHTAEYGIYFSGTTGFTISDNSFAVSQAGDNDDAWDDTAGNTWSNNHYSAITAAGPYMLPGTGGANDANAQPLVPGFGASVATALPPGHSPVDIVLANLDNDTDLDFAALSQAATPALAIGNNSGGSFSVAALPFGTAGGAPVAVVAGEFDGLPGRDLAALTVNVPPALTENRVFVFANNGSGGFSLLHSHTLAGATAPTGLAAGRLDGDTIDDLVVSDTGPLAPVGGAATALLNNGSGTLFVPSPLVAAFTVACRDVTIGDFNGDGARDVAVAEGASGVGRVHLFANNGAGVFTPMGGSPITVSANTVQLLATDLEADGDVDLAVASWVDDFGFVPGAVDVLSNNGAGVFSASQYIVDRGPMALGAGDLDDDADPDTVRPDLAVVNRAAGSVSILGSWARAGSGTGGIAAAGTVGTAVAIGDVNGDGYAELLYSDAAAGTVTTRFALPLAHAHRYGAGTGGTGAVVPDLRPVGAPAVPVIGNATFGIGLQSARPFSIAVIAAGLSAAPVLPASILIGDIGATWAVVTTASGTAAVPVPVPNNLALAGFEFFGQAGVFDVNGNETFFPGFALTNARQFRVGY